MPRLERLIRKRRRVPIGELRDRLFVEDRIQKAPGFGLVDAGMSFPASDAATEIWAKVVTKSGLVVFDGVATDRRVTHEVTFRKLSGISPETWLRLHDGTRLDIVETEDLDERGEFVIARCEATGSDEKGAASR